MHAVIVAHHVASESHNMQIAAAKDRFLSHTEFPLFRKIARIFRMKINVSCTREG